MRYFHLISIPSNVIVIFTDEFDDKVVFLCRFDLYIAHVYNVDNGHQKQLFKLQ